MNGKRQFSPARIFTLTLLALTTVMSGCGSPPDEDLDRTYGRRGGAYGRASVNGTAVLSQMFRDAGHKVLTKRELTPSVFDADVLVWIPDDFSPPSEEVADWMDSWFDATDGGVMIYVGRDFDAAIPYWEAVLPGATGTTATELASRRDRDLDSFGRKRTVADASTEFRWYNYDRTPPRRKVTQLSGPWSEGIDATQVEMELYGKMSPGTIDYENREILLASGDDPLITRIEFPHADDYDDEDVYYYGDSYYVDKSSWEPGELIFVTNGSFVLNEPLVNHENRKLARKLIDRCAGKKTVVFLESDYGGLPIKDYDPPPEVPSSLMIFTVWPLNIILVHLAVVGVVFCFARWPIFGRPQRDKTVSVTDFGHHVAALGAMLARTGNRSYARHQLAVYRQAYKSDAASLEPPTGDTKLTPPEDEATSQS